MAKLFSRLFNTGTGGGAEITEFYSDRVEDKARRKKIRSIEIPQEIRRFTTGDIPFTTDGSFPGIRVRYDASREEGTSGWTIRRFLDIKTQEGERLPPGLKNGEHDDILIGSPACDFDALHELSEESAKRDHLIKQENGLFSTFFSPYKGYGDTPHWRAIAEKANQPVDKHGYVQPVVRGEVLADHITFNDPKQIKILNSTLPPAITPAPEPVQQAAPPPSKPMPESAPEQPPVNKTEEKASDKMPLKSLRKKFQATLLLRQGNDVSAKREATLAAVEDVKEHIDAALLKHKKGEFLPSDTMFYVSSLEKVWGKDIDLALVLDSLKDKIIESQSYGLVADVDWSYNHPNEGQIECIHVRLHRSDSPSPRRIVL